MSRRCLKFTSFDYFEGLPDVYTRIYAHGEWIQRVLEGIEAEEEEREQEHDEIDTFDSHSTSTLNKNMLLTLFACQIAVFVANWLASWKNLNKHILDV